MRFFLISAFVVILDQVSKILTKQFMNLYDSKQVLGDFVRYTYIQNSGMAFGIQIGNKTVFTIISILASIIIFVYLLRTSREKKVIKFSLSLILGGAIGNLIDRILYGAVVDFIDVGIGELRWPVFNVADSAVSIGMILLVAIILFEKKPESTELSSPSSEQSSS